MSAGKAYYMPQFIAGCRERGIILQISMKITKRHGSAINARNIRLAAYLSLQRLWNRMKEYFCERKISGPPCEMKLTPGLGIYMPLWSRNLMMSPINASARRAMARDLGKHPKVPTIRSD